MKSIQIYKKLEQAAGMIAATHADNDSINWLAETGVLLQRYQNRIENKE